MLIWKLDF